MYLTSPNILSIVAIAFYSPVTLLSIFLCLRHGFSPNTGFIFLIFFSLIRISGAALNLASITAAPMQAGILTTASLVLSFTGVSPLMLAALGLVYRVRFGMVKIYPTTIKPVHLVLLRVPVMAALVLCDEGAIEYGATVGARGIYHVPVTSKVGIVIFMFVSIATALVTLFLFRIRFRFDHSDQLVLYAVAVSLPFLFARIIYGVLGAYSPDMDFGFFRGSVLLLGCMSILPEMIVIIIYSVLGLFLPRRVKPPPPEKKKERRKTKIVLVKPWKVVGIEAAVPPLDADPDDVDNASIQGSIGEESRESGEEKFVELRARESVAGRRYLGTMHSAYLPPLTLIDSAIVLDKLEP